MSSSDKLGLVQYSLKHLVDQLQPTDTLGIVVYAGSEGIVLEPTAVSDKSAILDAIDALESGGSTNGEAGIRAAYDLAEGAMRAGGINRVVLCTDGDFNVGLTEGKLVNLIEDFRDRGIFLTALGFGDGNYNDATMEMLADKGNGNYGYIDSPNEALRMLGEQLVSTLQVVAKDTKVQVTFAEGAVKRWRLIGYENRVLDNDDYANDDVDAGDIGAGHDVTALYELELAPEATGELASVHLRYKEPDSDESTDHAWAIDASARKTTIDGASAALRWGAAVAEFAEILRASEHSTGARFEDVSALAAGARPASERDDVDAEFLDLVGDAQALWP